MAKKDEANTQREFAWVGREFAALLKEADGEDVRDILKVFQRGGKRVGGLINALHDIGITTLQKPKREVSEEQRAVLSERLAKARKAKQGKADPLSEMK